MNDNESTITTTQRSENDDWIPLFADRSDCERIVQTVGTHMQDIGMCLDMIIRQSMSVDGSHAI